MTADLQSRRRLGLTATLVREDGREGDVFSLIGPEAVRRAVEGHRGAGLDRAGRVHRGAGDADRRRADGVRDRRARGALQDRAPPRAPRSPVVQADPGPAPRRADAGHRRLPRPAGRARRGPGRADHPGLDDEQGARAAVRRVPRAARCRTLVVSKVANFSIDLPEATVAIQVSGHVRLAAGGGAAARPGAAAQGRRAAGALLLGGRPATPSTPTTPRTGSGSSPSRATPTGSSTPTTCSDDVWWMWDPAGTAPVRRFRSEESLARSAPDTQVVRSGGLHLSRATPACHGGACGLPAGDR